MKKIRILARLYGVTPAIVLRRNAFKSRQVTQQDYGITTHKVYAVTLLIWKDELSDEMVVVGVGDSVPKKFCFVDVIVVVIFTNLDVSSKSQAIRVIIRRRLFMASGDSYRDAKDALSKLLQMERSTTTIAKPNNLNTGAHVQDLEETIHHKPNKVEVFKTSRVATSEEHEHQENQDNLNEISEKNDDAKLPISADAFGSNGGDDSETSGLETLANEAENIGIGDVLGLLDSWGTHNFAQPNAGTGSEMVSGVPKEFQEGDMVDALSRVAKRKKKDDAKPPIFIDNGGNDSRTSGSETPAKEVVENGIESEVVVNLPEEFQEGDMVDALSIVEQKSLGN
nr:hypothetical protein [Tanacetum cinerariifolium]